MLTYLISAVVQRTMGRVIISPVLTIIVAWPVPAGIDYRMGAGDHHWDLLTIRDVVISRNEVVETKFDSLRENPLILNM